MSIDHSLTYTDNRLKNLPHRMRLNSIIKTLNQMKLHNTLCDIGCSNGYITNLISEKFNFSSITGLDHNKDNIEIARKKYLNINFDFIDLNTIVTQKNKYKFITCFETLEHVGNLDNALENLLNCSDNGAILISVPIEVGFIGLLKFLTKTILFGYRLDEINQSNEKRFYLKYLFTLISNKSISKYRNTRGGYGTHFGFDYRDIKNWLNSRDITFSMQRKGTSVFFTIEN